jgi:Icc-related predicted phosphoesterase
MFKLYFVSDIHTESVGSFTFEPHKQDYLVIVGDIGKPKQKEFFETINNASKNFYKVFIVCGNNDLYTKEKETISEIYSNITKVCSKFDNVYFLNNSSFDLKNNVKIIGSTLWSYIPEDKHKDTICRNKNCATSQWSKVKCREMYDFDEKNNIKEVLPADINMMHNLCIQYLKDEILLAKQQSKKLIICTHYSPTMKLIKRTDIDYLFAGELDYLIDDPVIAWISGHSHYNNTVIINNIPVTMNCLGYPDQKTGFRKNKHLLITTKK